jgi:hypothetical protein
MASLGPGDIMLLLLSIPSILLALIAYRLTQIVRYLKKKDPDLWKDDREFVGKPPFRPLDK